MRKRKHTLLKPLQIKKRVFSICLTAVLTGNLLMVPVMADAKAEGYSDVYELQETRESGGSEEINATGSASETEDKDSGGNAGEDTDADGDIRKGSSEDGNGGSSENGDSGSGTESKVSGNSSNIMKEGADASGESRNGGSSSRDNGNASEDTDPDSDISKGSSEKSSAEESNLGIVKGGKGGASENGIGDGDSIRSVSVNAGESINAEGASWEAELTFNVKLNGQEGASVKQNDTITLTASDFYSSTGGGSLSDLQSNGGGGVNSGIDGIQFRLLRKDAGDDVFKRLSGDYKAGVEIFDIPIVNGNVSWDRETNTATQSNFDFYDYILKHSNNPPMQAGQYYVIADVAYRTNENGTLYPHNNRYRSRNACIEVKWKRDEGAPIIGTAYLEDAYLGETYSKQLQAVSEPTGHTLEWSFAPELGWMTKEDLKNNFGIDLSLTGSGLLTGNIPNDTKALGYSNIAFKVTDKNNGKTSYCIMAFNVTNDNKKKNYAWKVNKVEATSKMPGATGVSYTFEAVPSEDITLPASTESGSVSGIELTSGDIDLSSVGVSDVKLGDSSVSANIVIKKESNKITIGFAGTTKIENSKGISFTLTGITNPDSSYKATVNGSLSCTDFEADNDVKVINTGAAWELELNAIYANVTVNGLNDILVLSPTIRVNSDAAGSRSKSLGLAQSGGNKYYFTKSDIGKTFTFTLECSDSAGQSIENISKTVKLNSIDDTGNKANVVIGTEESRDISAIEGGGIVINLELDASGHALKSYTVAFDPSDRKDDISHSLYTSSGMPIMPIDGKVIVFSSSNTSDWKAECSTTSFDVKKQYDVNKPTVTEAENIITIKVPKLEELSGIVISGTVKAASQSPITGIGANGAIPNAIVTASQTIGDYSKSAAPVSTDKDGKYEIKGQLYSGYPITINVVATGFDKKSETSANAGSSSLTQDISLSPGAGSISVNLAVPIEGGGAGIEIYKGSVADNNLINDATLLWNGNQSAVIGLPSTASGTDTFALKLMKGKAQLGDTVNVTLSNGSGWAYIDNSNQGILDLSAITTDMGTQRFRAYVFANNVNGETGGNLMYELGIDSGIYALGVKAGTYDIIMVPDICPVTDSKSVESGGSKTVYDKSGMLSALSAAYSNDSTYYRELTGQEVEAGKEKVISGVSVPYSKVRDKDTADSVVSIPAAGDINGSWQITGIVRSLSNKKYKELHFVTNDPVAIYGITINGESRPIHEYWWSGYDKYGIYTDVSDIAPPYRFAAYVGSNNTSGWQYDGINAMDTTVLLSDGDHDTAKSPALSSGRTLITASMTIDAPKRTASEMVDFGGTAAADADITIYDNGVLAGHTKSDKYGRFSGTVTLNKDYRQHALSAVDESRSVSDTCYVRYESGEAALSELYMGGIKLNLNGRGITYTVNGIGYNGVKLEARFANGSKLKNTTLPVDGGSVTKKVFFEVETIGGLRLIPAEGSGDVYTATVDFGTDFPRYIKVIYGSESSGAALTATAKDTGIALEKLYKESTGLSDEEINTILTSPASTENRTKVFRAYFDELVKRANVIAGISNGNGTRITSAKALGPNDIGKEAEVTKGENGQNALFEYADFPASLPSYVGNGNRVTVKDDSGNEIEQYVVDRFFDTNAREIDAIVQSTETVDIGDESLSYQKTRFNENIKSTLREIYWKKGSEIFRVRKLTCIKGMEKSPLYSEDNNTASLMDISGSQGIRAEGAGPTLPPLTGVQRCVEKVDSVGITDDTAYSVVTNVQVIGSAGVSMGLEKQMQGLSGGGLANNLNDLNNTVNAGITIGTNEIGKTSMDTGHAARLNACDNNYGKIVPTYIEMYKNLTEAQKNATSQEDLSRIAILKNLIRGELKECGIGEKELGQAIVCNDFTQNTTGDLDDLGAYSTLVPGATPATGAVSATVTTTSTSIKVYNDVKVDAAIDNADARRRAFERITGLYEHDRKYFDWQEEERKKDEERKKAEERQFGIPSAGSDVKSPDNKNKNGREKDAEVSSTVDPSGFVFEAVSSNVITDATVTLYRDTGNTAGKSHTDYVPKYSDKNHKVLLADTAYGVQAASGTDKAKVTGDAAAVMDMADYGQQNPLKSDAEGHYSWFTPPGLWYVEAYKEGYEKGNSNKDKAAIVQGVSKLADNTTARNWLPVMPPQLNVHIPLTDYTAPEIPETDMQFKTDGIYIAFSKYMDASLLKAESLHLYNSDGSVAGFRLDYLNKEKAPGNIDYGNDDVPEYVSRICVAPESGSFTTGGEMTLTISGNVASYAGTVLGAQLKKSDIITQKTSCSEPVFKVNGSVTSGGKVPDSTVLTITCGENEYIVYTTDGSEPSESSLKRHKGKAEIAIDGDMTVKAIAVRDGFYKSNVKTAEFRVYRKSDVEISNIPDTPAEDEKQDGKQDEKQVATDDGYKTSEAITVGEDSYTVKWTRAVSYNGLKHIEVGGKGGKSKATDIEIFVLKNGETINSGFKAKFKNNQYVNGYKGKPAPYFSLTFKGKENKAVKQAFKSLKFEFDILPAELVASKLAMKKAVVKNGKIKLSGLKYSGGAKAVKLKPQKGSKGDYAATVSDNSIILTGVNNFYGTAVIAAQVSEPKDEKEEKAE